MGPLNSQIKYSTFETISPKGYRCHKIGYKPDYHATSPCSQLIAGLRQVGQKRFCLELKDYAVKINQADSVSSYFKMIEKDGKTYVLAELLAAPFLSQWRKDTQKNHVYIQGEDGKDHEFSSISIPSEFYNETLIYIAIEDFINVFPQITYIEDKRKIQLNFS